MSEFLTWNPDVKPHTKAARRRNRWGTCAFTRGQSFQLHLSQFPWRAKSNPLRCLPGRCTCRELRRDIRNNSCLVYKKWSSLIFWELSSLVLKNVGRYLLSAALSDPPPYPTVLTGATATALTHLVLWVPWPWNLPSCPGSFSAHKLCFTCLSVPKLAQSPSTR